MPREFSFSFKSHDNYFIPFFFIFIFIIFFSSVIWRSTTMRDTMTTNIFPLRHLFFFFQIFLNSFEFVISKQKLSVLFPVVKIVAIVRTWFFNLFDFVTSSSSSAVVAAAAVLFLWFCVWVRANAWDRVIKKKLIINSIESQFKMLRKKKWDWL